MRIDMDITTCVDVIIGVCMLVSVLVGYHRGFLVTIARIVAMVAAYIGAVLAAGTLKKMLAEDGGLSTANSLIILGLDLLLMFFCKQVTTAIFLYFSYTR